VSNNPLSYTDPSGRFIFMLIAAALTAKFNLEGLALLAFAVAGYLDTGTIEGAMFGFISGAIGLGISPVFNAALKDATGWALIGQTALVAASFGVAQGMVAKAAGGRFKDGFMGTFAGIVAGSATGVAKIRNSMTRLVATAVAGGTASKLGGGKFGNGAITGAFVYAVASGAQAAHDSHLSQDVGENFQHFDGDLDSQTPSEFPAATKRALGEVLDSPIGDQIRADVAANGKIDVILTDNSDLWFYTDDGARQIFYTTDLAKYISTATRITGDGLDSATMGTQLAHEIGHVLKPLTVGGFNASRINEIQTVRNYENIFRQHKQLPGRCSYFTENDVC